jgi:class 3 adenylate cyclase
MQSFANWSVRYKLLSLLLVLGIGTFLFTGTVAYVKFRGSLKQDAMRQLTGVTRSKQFQIESYYETIQQHAETLSTDRMFIDAAREFRAAYRKLGAASIPADTQAAVRADYQENFYPEMQKLNLARPRVEDYLPTSPAAFQLQYLYVVKNPHPPERRDELVNAGDGSDYSSVHEKYHSGFRHLIKSFGYYDFYLIDYETGRVLYDVSKDRDFGTDLLNGPYRNSNLAKVLKRCLATNNPDAVFFSDFEPYEASKGEPTQFVASPIYDGQERIGVFALQLSTDAINNVMTGKRGWEKYGLGQTGDSAIVGQDRLVRTNDRQYLEHPDDFIAGLSASGMPDEKLQRIRLYETTILQVPTRAPTAVAAALEGKEGTLIEKDALGPGKLLVSYMPLHIKDLHWVVVSRTALDDALKPVGDMGRMFGWWGAGLLLVTAIGAWLMTRQILRPVNALVSAAAKVASGDLTAKVEWKWKDELGVLSDTFNSMTKSIREKTEVIEQKNRENEALLLNILPAEIGARLKGGEHEIADNFADVTVLFGDIVGFTVLSSHTPPKRIVDILNGIFSLFDREAHELGIEKIKTIGDCYMAVCGLPHPYSDHADRMARMAFRMMEAIRRYNKEKGTNLQLRIGINSGPVVAGVIGMSKFIYDLWGDTVNIASRMESTGVPGEIQVTRSVYERLKGKFELESRGVVQVKGKGEIETWLLNSQLGADEAVA